MENVEISVFDPTAIKVGGGVGFRVKWGGILSFTLASCSNQMSFFLCGAKTNILGNLRLVLLVEENKGVVAGVASVKESPSFARMGGVLKLHTQRWLSRNGG